MTYQLLFGFLLAVIVASMAWYFNSLSKSGALGAVLIGTVIFGLGGWKWAIILLTFFISSSMLSRMFSNRKTGLSEKFEKGSQRDMSQVLANGGIAAIFTIMHFFFPSESWPWTGFIASMAAVNADTWATELGVLNPGPPRLMTNFKKVEKGTSGAISLVGTLASFLGASLVAIIAIFLMPVDDPILLYCIISISGILGSGFDSLLGSTIQAIYRCPACNKETERHPLHSCGTETTLIRGLKWLNNDLVNAGCAFAGPFFALLFLWIVR
ncbi:MAG TPA: DUF92 domain-containing protein [Anaerolineales bacterium]|nr:DUF92 domain-containing protein [Anaerolineales bacterium]